MFRKRLTPFAGMMVSIFFIIVGLERILIEQIRVNEKANYLGFNLTQSEFISILLIIFGFSLGVFTYIFHSRKNKTVDEK
jgi:phosphatidylglycerol:prolipoprotein diacylglycerol transferase